MNYNENMAAAQCEKPASQVESDRQELDRTLDRIMALADMLEMRLAAVIPDIKMDAPAAPKAVTSVEPTRSPLAERLQSMNYSAKSSERTLERIIKSIQL